MFGTSRGSSPHQQKIIHHLNPVNIRVLSFQFLLVLMLLLSQFSPTLCNPTDVSPPGSPVSEILQTRTLECYHDVLP